MLAFINCFVAFTVVFETPHGTPQPFIIGSNHATFAASGHDLILAKTPSSHMTNTSNTTSFINGAVRLCTIFDHFEMMLICKFHDRIHITWPASKVDTDNRFSFGGYNRCNGLS
jgi:hypothetical protein